MGNEREKQPELKGVFGAEIGGEIDWSSLEPGHWTDDKRGLIDNSGNRMLLVKSEGNFHVFKKQDDENGLGGDKGYVTETDENFTWPGSIITWFGTGERFKTANEAMKGIRERFWEKTER